MSKIALLLSPGFADWEYAFIAGMGGPFFGLDIKFFATQPGQIQSQGGLQCIVSNGLDELTHWAPNVIVVVGSKAWEQPTAPDISVILHDQLEREGTVAGICGGTLALARTGLLDHIPHTSNSPDYLEKAKVYAGAKRYVESTRAISSNRVISAPGTAPASFTAKVFSSAGLDSDTVTQFRMIMKQEHVHS